MFSPTGSAWKAPLRQKSALSQDAPWLSASRSVWSEIVQPTLLLP